MEFKKIILIGVDGYTGYFQPWDNPVFHSDYGGLEKNKNHSLHSTSNPKFGLPTVPECFYLLNERFIEIGDLVVLYRVCFVLSIVRAPGILILMARWQQGKGVQSREKTKK